MAILAIKLVLDSRLNITQIKRSSNKYFLIIKKKKLSPKEESRLLCNGVNNAMVSHQMSTDEMTMTTLSHNVT